MRPTNLTLKPIWREPNGPSSLPRQAVGGAADRQIQLILAHLLSVGMFFRQSGKDLKDGACAPPNASGPLLG